MERLTKTFTNWAGTQTCLPTRWHTPPTTTEVAEIVGDAARRGQRVKAAGAGHSFSDIALTDGVMLSLDRLDGLSDHDPEHDRVTVGAGIRLCDLNERLHDLGLAMPNLGDIDVQSLAGATATATHGTGARLGNLSTAIVGFELVTGTGEVLWCDAEQHPDVFAVGRVGLGALGVLTRIRLQCVPSFTLRATERVTGLDDTLGRWREFIDGADHAELFFIPGLGACFTKQNRRTDETEQPPSRLRYWIEKDFAENIALDLAMRAHRRWPQRRDTILKGIAAVSSDREVVDRSYRVFASPRTVKFMEMEYGIPVDAVPEAVGRVAAMVKAMDRPPLFPIEVRCSAGDDIAPVHR